MAQTFFPGPVKETYAQLKNQLMGNGFKPESIEKATDSIHDYWAQTAMTKQYIRCNKCDLCCEKKVPGAGNIDSPLMIIGEGPGKEELEMRVPFVGACGLTITMMLDKFQVSRSRVYITNATKCNTPNASGKLQNPTEQHIGACLSHLLAEIQLIQPKVILALGTRAMWALLFDFETKIGEQRGKILSPHPDYGVDAKLVCTYHPSYLLRQGNSPKAQEVQKIMLADIYGAVQLAKQAAPYYDFNKKPLFLEK